MTRMMRIALALVAAVPGACVSMGPNYDPAVIDRLQPGMPKAEVIALLGRPTSTTSLADRRQHLMWVHSRGDMLGRGQARAVILIFGPDGRYIGMASQSETSLR